MILAQAAGFVKRAIQKGGKKFDKRRAEPI
jgi:hypothetical protein